MFSQMAELTFFQGDYLSGFSDHNKSPAGKENVNLRNLIPMEYLAGQTYEMKTNRACGNPRPYRQDRSLPIPEQS